MAGQEAAAQRAVGDEANAQFTTGRQHRLDAALLDQAVIA
jgi:hypothetical protein